MYSIIFIPSKIDNVAKSPSKISMITKAISNIEIFLFIFISRCDILTSEKALPPFGGCPYGQL
jgi:hypothetical protein